MAIIMIAVHLRIIDGRMQVGISVMEEQLQQRQKHRDLMKQERPYLMMKCSLVILSFTVSQTTEDIRISAMWQYMSAMARW